MDARIIALETEKEAAQHELHALESQAERQGEAIAGQRQSMAASRHTRVRKPEHAVRTGNKK